MSATLEQLKDVAGELPTADRVELARFLLSSVNEGEELVAAAEWLAVAQERMVQIKAGKVVGIPADEVMRTLLSPAQ